jgi:hypothetical protein
VADLYIVIFDAALNNPQSTKHGREGFYFGENGEHVLIDLYKKVAEVLYALGKGQSPEPTKFTDEELKKYKVRATRIYLSPNSHAQFSNPLR